MEYMVMEGGRIVASFRDGVNGGALEQSIRHAKCEVITAPSHFYKIVRINDVGIELVAEVSKSKGIVMTWEKF
jgi:hypothetical protein